MPEEQSFHPPVDRFFPTANPNEAKVLGKVAAKAKTEKDHEDATQKLLNEADDLLREVDESYLLTQKTVRSYPVFDRIEVRLGALLGQGGFCKVFEVESFTLKEDKIPVEKEEGKRGSAVKFSVSEDKAEHPPAEGKSKDDAHYEVAEARNHMNLYARRNGDARYAVKRLHRDLTDLERARGMVDLAIEAKYLSVLWHPNIVRMRGMSSGPLLNPQFFIVMDRLYDTLSKRVKQWRTSYDASKGNLFGIGAKKNELLQLMTERMIVAYDLASAFRYMHENRLIYRDTKKENIAFDVRGDVKIFDFGLSKSFSPAQKARDSLGRAQYGYNLTPRTGSVPFMAPEVADCHPYDEKCDVFSFAILLWEILSLRTAFKGYTRREFFDRVVRNKERPNIGRQWPPLTRMMLKEAWDHDPSERPDMKRVAAMIRGDLSDLSTDTAVQERTTHMRDRSAHSFRLHARAGEILQLSEDEK